MTTAPRPARLRLIGAAAALGALALGGCTTEGAPSTPTGHHSATGVDSPRSSTATHNAADVTFAQMMIPHHQQAIEMSEVLLTQQGLDAPVNDLARRIVATQGQEIVQLRGWLVEWGMDPTPTTSGGHHGGGGMSESDMEDLRSARGDRARELFLTGMIEHHRGAITMAQAELAQGRHEGARRLAEEIIRAQENEIAEMTALLDNP